MIILCTHNNGGVGKTTLAIHAAGALVKYQPTSKTLVVDCDDQADSFKFYVGQDPSRNKQLIRQGNLSIISNKDRESIKRVADPEEYDNIVIDIDSPLSNSVQTIVQDDPDLILVPINTSQQSKALNNLPRTLEVIAKLESKAGYEPKVRIVSLGVQVDRIRNVVEKCKSKPSNYKIVEQMPELQEKMQVAIYEERKYIWEYEGCEFLYSYFCSVLEV